jgi:hypothetical protein
VNDEDYEEDDEEEEDERDQQIMDLQDEVVQLKKRLRGLEACLRCTQPAAKKKRSRTSYK